jgi:hypothetical protein
MEPSPRRRIIGERDVRLTPLSDPESDNDEIGLAGLPARRRALEVLAATEAAILALSRTAAQDVSEYVTTAAQDGRITVASVIQSGQRIQHRLDILAMEAAREADVSLDDAAIAAIDHERAVYEEQRRRLALLAILGVLAADRELAQMVVNRALVAGIQGETNQVAMRRGARIISDNIMARLNMAAAVPYADGKQTGEPVGSVLRDIRPQITGQRMTDDILAARVERTGYGALAPRFIATADRSFLSVFGQAQLAWGEEHEEYLVGYLWKLGFNENHCRVCLDLAGRVYPVNAPELRKFTPHRNCRCSLHAVWKEA